MKKRLIYGSGIFLLLVLMTLVVWQGGSFSSTVYTPADPTQTLVLWPVSLLIFILMVALGFMLVRNGVKLLVERRSNREGSRIRTKLVAGAIALSITPVVFMVIFSYEVMSHNLDKWQTRPMQNSKADFDEIATALTGLLQDKAEAQAGLLAHSPDVRLQLGGGPVQPGYLEEFCSSHEVAAARVFPLNSNVPVATCGSVPRNAEKDRQITVARHPVTWAARDVGEVAVYLKVPLNVYQKRSEIEKYDRQFNALARSRNAVRLQSTLILCVITLFTIYVATWIAFYLSRQISVPIAALARAAQEVGQGNTNYRVEVGAIDELAGLVNGFNRMTSQLEANSRELNARRRFTEAILENIPTGVISMAADGSIQRVNRALKGILPEELVTKARKLEDLFPSEDAAEIRYLMKRARRTGLSAQQLELKFGGATLHLAVTVSALDNQISSGFVMVIEDTSDLLRAQKAAAWNEVARRIAHEIRNPLTPIGLSAERIARQLERARLTPEMAAIIRECTDTIINEVESVKGLVNEFSQFARFPAAKPERAFLNDVVESALSVFAGRLENIRLSVDLAPSLPPVMIDREQFKRVVVNLVDNAAEAMQESLVRNLDVVTQLGAADTIELIVADTGAGVSPEDREKLFVPYFSTKGRGTGLGLAIVNNILSEHHAHIRVEDNVPAGTRFTVEIPVILEAQDAPESAVMVPI
jgi:two-component system, NtrC family, nitrogen regulation sensor histidine kinase NtrY